MQGFEVLEGGIHSTIQDLGRYGYAHLGVTPSGAMDEYAYRWSQKLLDNTEANAIEVLLGGLKLQALEECTISICGADLDFKINGKPVGIWQTHYIKKGDIVGFYGQRSGLRAYLAVKNGFNVEKIDGSFATTVREHKGTKLKKNNFLTFTSSSQIPRKRLAKKYIPQYNETLTLHIVLTSQNHYFSQKEQQKFLEQNYTLTSEINAMGYKLQGEPIASTYSDIISEGIAFGVVQIPQDGQPIILLKERQTIGGYPKIGTVLASDCFALSQLGIGKHVNFKTINIENAQRKMKDFYGFFI